MTYEPRFDYDLAYGLEGERIARAWHAGRRETKRKRRLDIEFYIELEQNPRRAGMWKPSGLATSEADYFEFVIGNTGIIVAFPTQLLRDALEQEIGRDCEEYDGDNPTRGRLFNLIDLMTIRIGHQPGGGEGLQGQR